MFLAGPGGGANSGGGGRDHFFTFSDLSAYAKMLYETLCDFVDWMVSPIGDVLESSFVGEALSSIVPDSWLEATVVEFVIGSALFFFLLGSFVKWLRAVF